MAELTIDSVPVENPLFYQCGLFQFAIDSLVVEEVKEQLELD